MGWGGRWEGVSGSGTLVKPWLIHVNVWQNHYNIYLFTYFWLLDFHCHAGFSLAAESRGTLCCSARASPCGGSSCCGAQTVGSVGFSSCCSQAAKPRLSSCEAQAGLLLGMWNLPQPGMEPMSLHWQLGSLQLSYQGSSDATFKLSCSMSSSFGH